MWNFKFGVVNRSTIESKAIDDALEMIAIDIKICFGF